MLLPAALLLNCPISKAPHNCLFVAADRGPGLFWILERENVCYALFLLGSYAGRAFEIDDYSAGHGFAIGPVEIRVDTTSTRQADKRGTWDLMAKGGDLWISIHVGEGLAEKQLWAPVTSLSGSEKEPIYFSRWSLGVSVDETWTELFAANGGATTTDLVT